MRKHHKAQKNSHITGLHMHLKVINFITYFKEMYPCFLHCASQRYKRLLEMEFKCKPKVPIQHSLLHTDI